MIYTDRDALICDLAETYGIYDFKSLPVRLVATFSVGLRDNSRIMQKINNEPCTKTDFLLAVIADRLRTDESQPSLVSALLGNDSEEGNKAVMSFTSGEDFDKAWKE